MDVEVGHTGLCDTSTADAPAGLPEHGERARMSVRPFLLTTGTAPFRVIHVGAAASEMPKKLVDQVSSLDDCSRSCAEVP